MKVCMIVALLLIGFQSVSRIVMAQPTNPCRAGFAFVNSYCIKPCPWNPVTNRPWVDIAWNTCQKPAAYWKPWGQPCPDPYKRSGCCLCVPDCALAGLVSNNAISRGECLKVMYKVSTQ
jgi:hypothetical protein